MGVIPVGSPHPKLLRHKKVFLAAKWVLRVRPAKRGRNGFVKKMSRTKKKIPGAQPTTPTASTAAIPALLPEDSPATEGTCVMPDGGDAENIAAPDAMRLDEETREDSSPVHSGYEFLGEDATRKTFR